MLLLWMLLYFLASAVRRSSKYAFLASRSSASRRRFSSARRASFRACDGNAHTAVHFSNRHFSRTSAICSLSYPKTHALTPTPHVYHPP